MSDQTNNQDGAAAAAASPPAVGGDPLAVDAADLGLPSDAQMRQQDSRAKAGLQEDGDGGGYRRPRRDITDDVFHSGGPAADGKGGKHAPTFADPDAPEDDDDDADDGTGDDDAPTGKRKGKESGGEISDELRSRAEEAGFSKEEVAEYDDAKALERDIERAERAIARRMTDAGQRVGQDGKNKKPDGKGDQHDDGASADDSQEFKFSDIEWQPTFEVPDDVHPDIKENLVGSAKRIAQLERVVMPLVKAAEAQRQQQMFDRFDAAVDALGHESLYGKSGELKEDSEPFKARAAVYNALVVLHRGYVAEKRQMPSFPQMVRMAAQVAHGDELAKAAQRSVGQKLRRQRERMLTPPTHRGEAGKEVSPQKAASRFAARFMAEHGVEQENQDTFTEDLGLPGR